MMAVPVRLGPVSKPVRPWCCFRRTCDNQFLRKTCSYGVSGDGQRFLVNTKVDEPNGAPLSIILNWASEMEK